MSFNVREFIFLCFPVYFVTRAADRECIISDASQTNRLNNELKTTFCDSLGYTFYQNVLRFVLGRSIVNKYFSIFVYLFPRKTFNVF